MGVGLAARCLEHFDSVFGLGASGDGTFFASGDYKGKVIIWKRNNQDYEHLETLNVQGSIEDISWRDDGAFAAVNSSGHVYFFEAQLGTSPEQWQLVLETDTATGAGEWIHLSKDNKSFLAGTYADLIQVDLDTQHIQQTSLDEVRKIFSKEDKIFVLTRTGLLGYDKKEVRVPPNLVKYQFAKVSLIGHTGAGKITLCSLIVKGPSTDIKSTFGRKAWNWKIDAEAGSLERRIILHDHGGQETVLSTFLPFVANSDLILLFFKKNDVSTFTKALSSLDQLRSIVSPKTKMLFVETYIDQPIDEIDEGFVKKLIMERVMRGWGQG